MQNLDVGRIYQRTVLFTRGCILELHSELAGSKLESFRFFATPVFYYKHGKWINNARDVSSSMVCCYYVKKEQQDLLGFGTPCLVNSTIIALKNSRTFLEEIPKKLASVIIFFLISLSGLPLTSRRNNLGSWTTNSHLCECRTHTIFDNDSCDRHVVSNDP